MSGPHGNGQQPKGGPMALQVAQAINDTQWIAQMAIRMPSLTMTIPPAEEGGESTSRPATRSERVAFAAEYLAEAHFFVQSGNFGVLLDQANENAVKVVNERARILAEQKADEERRQAEADAAEEQAKKEFRARQEEERRLKLLSGETGEPAEPPKLVNESGDAIQRDTAA